MKLFSPTPYKRLNEATGVVLLCLGLILWLSLVSYRSQDASWNTAAGGEHPVNLIGYVGSYLADLFLQAFGLCAFLLPITCFLLSWKWLRSEPLANPGVKTFGMA
ncbi:MAG: DNA translocase FtsK 4TM domain-containing protein, partial [Candidatus Solibacter usitatus]|nr:DNA translocase FtsK 4TM domain-containing protein [Candidatus Solibacter usitatus]